LIEAVGAEKIDIDEMHDTEALQRCLAEKFPELKNKTYRIAINKTLIQNKTLLNDGDVIALLPPFSGG
jgi:molybdopterin synthase sulfur carrier subunit